MYLKHVNINLPAKYIYLNLICSGRSDFHGDPISIAWDTLFKSNRLSLNYNWILLDLSLWWCFCVFFSFYFLFYSLCFLSVLHFCFVYRFYYYFSWIFVKDGIGGSYRLASLDRLATRQRILEQNGGAGSLADKNGTAVVSENGVSNGSSIPYSVRIQTNHISKALTMSVSGQ